MLRIGNLQAVNSFWFWLNLKTVYPLINISLWLVLLSVAGCNYYSNTKSLKSQSWMGECDLESLANFNYQENNKTEPVIASNYVSMKHTQKNYFIGNQKIAIKDSQGKIYITIMNGAQQRYFSENNEFATNLKDLELGIESETEHYTLKIFPQYGF
ncbi:MAG: type IV pilin-like G/H family protein, partial [Cyanobacteriota bacterium]|nr:type IV pilin-like G/H family protein [Cyanobacteriota bacterium]